MNVNKQLVFLKSCPLKCSWCSNPENHKNLIVRVWGWSGYFNELDMQFKQHIIKRTEFVM